MPPPPTTAPRASPTRRAREQPRPAKATAATGGQVGRARGVERRRREQRFRERRRDLLGDGVIALVVAIIALIVAPGLGVIAILSVPIACALAGTAVVERRARKRRNHDPRRSGPRPRT